MFRRMIAIVILAVSLLTFAGPVLAVPGADDLADPRPSPAVSFDEVHTELADPRPSPIVKK